MNCSINTWMLLAACVVTALAAGCSSMTPRFDDQMPPMNTPTLTSSGASFAPKPALKNPQNQELEIALQTARLAEERAMDTEAISAYENVRDLNPQQPGIAHALAVLYDRANRTDAAQREYNAALEESPQDVNVLCDYGYFLYSSGNMEQSEEILRRGLAVDAQHRQSKINLATVLATRQQYDEAKQLFESAIGPAAALHNIGLFKIRAGQVMEGQAMIASAAQQDPSLQQPKHILQHVGQPATIPALALNKGGHKR